MRALPEDRGPLQDTRAEGRGGGWARELCRRRKLLQETVRNLAAVNHLLLAVDPPGAASE